MLRVYIYLFLILSMASCNAMAASLQCGSQGDGLWNCYLSGLDNGGVQTLSISVEGRFTEDFSVRKVKDAYFPVLIGYGVEDGYLQLSFRNKVVYGILIHDDREYALRLRSGRGFLRQKGVYLAPEAPMSVVRERFRPSAYSVAAEDGRHVDLLLLYTPALKEKLGDYLDMYIVSLLEYANEAFANDGIDLRLQLVGTQVWTDSSMDESVSTSDALSALTDSLEVRTLRDDLAADIVILLRNFEGMFYCGMAWGLTSLDDPTGSSAYIVVNASAGLPDESGYYCPTFVFAHEVGHLFGCQHDPAHADGPGLYPYSYGYSIPGILATIMTYDSPVIPYFSSPLYDYDGYSVGVSGVADNALTIANVKTFVANYRQDLTGGERPIDTDEELIAQLYVGYFGRAPDSGGLYYWERDLRSGQSLLEIANSFALSEEAGSLYPFLTSPAEYTPEEFITSIYRNLFGRAPDAGGLAYWLSELESGRISPPSMIMALIDGAKAATGSARDEGVLENRVYVALQSMKRCEWMGEDFIPFSRELLRSVSYSMDSVESALTTITDVCGGS